MTKENRRKLKDLGIQCMGARLGRPPKVKPQEQIEKERIGNSLRNEVEAAFGTSKRVYRADNIRAKLPGTAECWTGMCYFVKNLTKFLRGLCRVLTEKLPSMRILAIIRLAIGELTWKILPPCCSEAKNADCLRRLVQRILNNNKNTRLYTVGCEIGWGFCKVLIISVICGERGIRTPGALQHDGFQDRCNRPLYHLSLAVCWSIIDHLAISP